jgi:glutathione S-transferase
MRLYYVPGSSSLSSHIVLIESGLPFEKVKTDEHTKIMEGGGDYKTVNPLGYVPSLQLDDGTLLTEAPAIVQFIADNVPAKKLAPPNGTLERTKLQSWLNFFRVNCTREGFLLFSTAGCPRKQKRSSASTFRPDLLISISILPRTSA